MARMQQLGGAVFEGFKRRDLEYLRAMMQARRSLVETKKVCDWLPILQSLGADMANVQTLVALAQQGHAGRIYANALLVKWMRQALDVQNAAT